MNNQDSRDCLCLYILSKVDWWKHYKGNFILCCCNIVICCKFGWFQSEHCKIDLLEVHLKISSLNFIISVSRCLVMRSTWKLLSRPGSVDSFSSSAFYSEDAINCEWYFRVGKMERKKWEEIFLLWPLHLIVWFILEVAHTRVKDSSSTYFFPLYLIIFIISCTAQMLMHWSQTWINMGWCP